jgi:transcriptional regulator with XRE-family HTH domain
VGEIDDAIERADRENFTRQPPKTLQARINFLMKQLKTTKAVAQEIGVSRRSVERYRKGERKHPPQAIAERIDAAVRQRWQPQVRKRRQQQAATTGGITVETRARFGYTAPIGTTDDGRFRRLTVHLPLRTRSSACSTPATQVPATSKCARSSPKDSKRPTSKTTEPALWGSPTSPSTTSTTSTSTTNLTPASGPSAPRLCRSSVAVT